MDNDGLTRPWWTNRLTLGQYWSATCVREWLSVTGTRWKWRYGFRDWRRPVVCSSSVLSSLQPHRISPDEWTVSGARLDLSGARFETPPGKETFVLWRFCLDAARWGWDSATADQLDEVTYKKGCLIAAAAAADTCERSRRCRHTPAVHQLHAATHQQGQQLIIACVEAASLTAPRFCRGFQCYNRAASCETEVQTETRHTLNEVGAGISGFCISVITSSRYAVVQSNFSYKFWMHVQFFVQYREILKSKTKLIKLYVTFTYVLLLLTCRSMWQWGYTVL